MTTIDTYKANSIWVVILAAGKGKRMKAKSTNKVAYEVSGIPMVSRTIAVLKKVGVKNIVVVVGFAKESVIKLLDPSIKTVEQKRRLGTGHAVKKALGVIPKDAEHVLVLNGDDSFLFSSELFKKLMDDHSQNNSAVTFLTIDLKNPAGLGRIIRDEKGKVIKIVEEKDATQKQKKIKEINAACYLFSCRFLREYIPLLKKSHVTHEYYIVSLIDLAARNGLKIDTLRMDNLKWRGVNTPKELHEAQKMIS